MFLFELYKDSQGNYRWRQFGENCGTVAHSAIGYENKSDCVSEILKMVQAVRAVRQDSVKARSES
jgi:uncharacterized protein YegP (UPF0339 family)